MSFVSKGIFALLACLYGSIAVAQSVESSPAYQFGRVLGFIAFFYILWRIFGKKT